MITEDECEEIRIRIQEMFQGRNESHINIFQKSRSEGFPTPPSPPPGNVQLIKRNIEASECIFS